MNEIIQWAIDYSVFLFIVLVVLNVVDVLSTLDILLLGGYEVNPIARYFMGLFPTKPALGFCLLKALTLFAGFILMREMTLHEVALALLVLCTFYVGVVAWNLKVIADLDGGL